MDPTCVHTIIDNDQHYNIGTSIACTVTVTTYVRRAKALQYGAERYYNIFIKSGILKVLLQWIDWNTFHSI